MKLRLPLLAVSLVLTAACGDDEGSSSDGNGGNGGSSSTGASNSGGSGTGGSGTGGNATGGNGNGGTANGGNGQGGGGTVNGSPGCGTASADAEETWVEKTMDVGGTTRTYFVRLPPGYDETSPYPVVYQFHGCSNSPNKENNNPPVHEHSGADAIVVRGRAVDNCWKTGANEEDVPYFDALVSEVESAYCADTDRRFAAGYSSGAFMVHRLACSRGDVLAGVASIAGGLAGNNCVGQTAALLIHDDTDNTVNISASISARDRHLTNNSCDDPPMSSPVMPAPCEAYAGCDSAHPVTWCQTTGNDHSRQDGLSAPAFWGFFSSL